MNANVARTPGEEASGSNRRATAASIATANLAHLGGGAPPRRRRAVGGCDYAPASHLFDYYRWERAARAARQPRCEFRTAPTSTVLYAIPQFISDSASDGAKARDPMSGS